MPDYGNVWQSKSLVTFNVHFCASAEPSCFIAEVRCLKNIVGGKHKRAKEINLHNWGIEFKVCKVFDLSIYFLK